MKLPLCTLMMALAIVSCGKKAEITNNEKEHRALAPSADEKYFNALREVKGAIEENNLPALKKSLAQNPEIDINQTLGDTGETFLIIAIKKDYFEIRDFLIEKGADIERPNVNKETPLIAAVLYNRYNTVRVLLDSKVEIDKRDMNGDTALHVAIKNSLDTIAMLLVKSGANIEATDKLDRNAHRLAHEFQVPQTLGLIQSYTELEAGAPDVPSFKALLVLADHKRLKKVLARYPKIALENAYESINPLAVLVDSKDQPNALRSAELLINYEANVNGPVGAEQTPLIKATLNQKKGFANLFLSSDANPQLLDKEGKSALIHAIEKNNLELVELLLSYSAVEKYSFRKDGKKISYNACDVAKDAAKKLETDKEIEINEKIKDRLECGFFSRFF